MAGSWFLAVALLAEAEGTRWQAEGPLAGVTEWVGWCCEGYEAEVLVVVGGQVDHGRVIVGGDGQVDVEHLGVNARRWVLGSLAGALTSQGFSWDGRSARVEAQWQHAGVGSRRVLLEMRDGEGWLRVIRWQGLGGR